MQLTNMTTIINITESRFHSLKVIEIHLSIIVLIRFSGTCRNRLNDLRFYVLIVIILNRLVIGVGFSHILKI